MARRPRKSDAEQAGRERPDRAAAASARAVAIRVLQRVVERGAYASRALDAELGRAGLDERDAALATEIAYGSLRVLPELDRALAPHLRRAADELDGFLRAALRAGSYQLLHLSRVPAHAVVDETVSAVRAARGRALAGVANAVLRRVAADAAAGGGAAQPRALVLPAALQAALQTALGADRASALLAAGQPSPPLALRLRAGAERAALADELRAARPSAELRPGPVSPLALLVRRAGDPRALPGYAEGRFSVQEEGAQVVAQLLGAQPGETIADLCAGHGGKTALLAELVGAGGRVLAADLDERKLERIPVELARLGLNDGRVQTRAIDLTVGGGGLPPHFDRVLVDAPCTGLGTLRRRPELMLRTAALDPERLAEVQLAILRQAVRLVRPGGSLLYAVCSPMLAEGAQVAARLQAETPALVRDPAAPALPLGVAADPDGVVRLGPWLDPEAGDSPDVYQLIRWQVRGA